MIKEDVLSNGQAWELEVVCKNKQYLDKVVLAILEQENIDFEVENVSESGNNRWTVFMNCSWFHNLFDITSKLKEIEVNEEGFNKISED